MVNKKLMVVGMLMLLLSISVLTANVEAKAWSFAAVNTSIPERLNAFYIYTDGKVYFSFHNDLPNGIALYSVSPDTVTTLYTTSDYHISQNDGFYNTTNRTLWIAGFTRLAFDNLTVMKYNDYTAEWDYETKSVGITDNQTRSFASVIEHNKSHLFFGEAGKIDDVDDDYDRNGGGIWSVAKGTWDDSSTWNRFWNNTDGWPITSMVKFGTDTFAFAANATVHEWSGGAAVVRSDFKIYKYNTGTGVFDEVYHFDNSDHNAAGSVLFVDSGQIYVYYPNPEFSRIFRLSSTTGNSGDWNILGLVQEDILTYTNSSDTLSVAGYIKGNNGSIYVGQGTQFNVYRWYFDKHYGEGIGTYSGGMFGIDPMFGFDEEDNFYFFAYTPIGQKNILYKEGWYDEYTVIVRAKDEQTKHPILDFSVTMNEYSDSTTTGIVTFTDIPPDIYNIQVVADGYTVGGASYAITTDKDITFYLYQFGTGAGEGVQFAPHYVQFFVKEWHIIYTEAVNGVTVNVAGLGNYTNITMNGTTGTDGAVTFKMSPTIRYKIDFIKGGWSTSLIIYPVDTIYTVWIIALFEDEPIVYEEATWSFSTNEKSATEMYLNFTYNDTSATTNLLNFYVYDNTTLIHSDSVADDSVHSFSYVLTPWKGKQGYLKFNATYTDNYFDPVKETKFFNFPLEARRVMLGDLDSYWYTFISIAILILLGSLFGAKNSHRGAVVVAFGGMGLWYVDWLSFGVSGAFTIIMCALVFAVLAYWRRRESEVM